MHRQFIGNLAAAALGVLMGYVVCLFVVMVELFAWMVYCNAGQGRVRYDDFQNPNKNRKCDKLKAFLRPVGLCGGTLYLVSCIDWDLTRVDWWFAFPFYSVLFYYWHVEGRFYTPST